MYVEVHLTDHRKMWQDVDTFEKNNKQSFSALCSTESAAAQILLVLCFVLFSLLKSVRLM